MTLSGLKPDIPNKFDEEEERRLLDYMAEFAAGAGHELNNPLAIVSALAQRLLFEESQETKRRDLLRIIEQTKRAHEMIADVRAFSRPPKLSWAPVDARDFFLRWVEREDRRASQRVGASLSFDAPVGDVTFVSDEAVLATVLDALGKNALEAIEGSGGRLHLFCRIEETNGEGTRASKIEIGIEDDGPRAPEEIRQLIFAPFFSGRQAGRGLGFGLCKALRYCETLGANLFCEDARSFSTGCLWGVRIAID